MASLALVAVIRHVPTPFAVRVDPESEHVVVPAAYVKEIAPEPEPPLLVRVNGVPYDPVVLEIERADCTEPLKVKVAAVLVAAAKFVSEAIVAVMRQVPELLAVRVAEAVEFESVHPLAVPPALMEYVIAPVPLLPDVLMDKTWE